MSTLLIIAMTPLWLVGLIIFFYIAKPIKKKYETQNGFDVSNRINRIRLLWRCLSRPWLFVNELPWLKNDEGDNG